MYITEDCNWTPYGTDPKLDKKVDSDDIDVRKAIARQGYGLDKLINDENLWVCEAVKNYLKEQHLTLEQWIREYPDKCVL